MNGQRARETVSHRRVGFRRWLGCALLLGCCLSAAAGAQSTPTASRAGDLQIGGGFALGNPGYNFSHSTLIGGALYATFDRREHWGFEAGFHQTRPPADPTVYERSYEIGPRFFFSRGRIAPYGKVLYGRGVYNFPNNVANIAYNLYIFGGGVDYRLTRSVNLRADYELQNWIGFPLGLRSNLFTFGIAYHFHP